MSRRDLEFLLYEWLDAEALTTRARYAEHDRDTFDAVLDLSEQIATDSSRRSTSSPTPPSRTSGTTAPWCCRRRSAARSRRTPTPGCRAACSTPSSAGCSCRSSCTRPRRPSSRRPASARSPTRSWPRATRACSSRTARPEQVRRYAEPVIAGRWYGTMALSEPQAGSSLGDITTRAVRQDDGSYRLTGTKMWISGGDHELGDNIVHLVLARTPGAAPGVKGISLFIVPKHLVDDDGSLGERNDVALVGLNHKMGYRATTNTLLNFGEGLTTPGRRRRRRRSPGRRGGPRPGLHVPHDERGPGQRRRRRGRPGLHRLPARPRLRPRPHPGPARSQAQGPGVAAGARWSSTPTCAACCWPRSPTSRAGSP